jgi:phenylalanyl-tRNA synthetase beta chain
VAVAGVMGGLNSEISDITERIIIEAANFNPVCIRRTAVRIGLRTEASNRFEKSLDPELTALGIVGSVYRIKEELPKASVLSGFLDVNFSKVKSINIPLNIDWASKLLGTVIDKKRVVDILTSLQFGIDEKDDKNMMVRVPTFRATKDVSIPQDLVEEIGRIFGYGNIKPVLPRIENFPPRKDELVQLISRMKQLFASELSMTEVYTYSFQEDKDIERFYREDFLFLRLKNPVSNDMSRLRRSIVPSLFSVIEKNISFKDEFSLFEIGSVYIPCKSLKGKKDDVTLPDEREMAVGAMLKRSKEGEVFFDMKGKLEVLCERLNIKGTEFVAFEKAGSYERCIDISNLGELHLYHPGRRALLVYEKTAFAVVCELNPKLLRDIGIDFSEYRIAFFTIDLRLLIDGVVGERKEKKYRKIPKYPEVSLALAVVVDEDISVREVENFILSRREKKTRDRDSILERVELFDIYRGKPLARGKKNLAFNVYYRREDRTLTEKEALIIHEDIAKKIRDHGWDLR